MPLNSRLATAFASGALIILLCAPGYTLDRAGKGIKGNVDVSVGRGNLADVDADVSIGGRRGLNSNADATVGGGSVADVDGDVSLGGRTGINADADATLGSGSVADVDIDASVGGRRDVTAAVGASIGGGAIGADLDVSLGGGLGAGVDLGIGGGGALPGQNGGGTGGIGSGGGVVGTPPTRQLPDSLARLSASDMQRVKRRCRGILGDPSGYDSALIALCKAL